MYEEYEASSFLQNYFKDEDSAINEAAKKSAKAELQKSAGDVATEKEEMEEGWLTEEQQSLAHAVALQDGKF